MGEAARAEGARLHLLQNHRIAFADQETAHGMKVLYDDRHRLEFAVFDPDELHLARINRYRVLFDRANLSATLAQLAARETAPQTLDIPYESAQFLTHLLVGLWRYQGGEHLSAYRFLRGLALQELVALTHALATPDRPDLRDTLDPTHRFETLYPAAGAAIAAALELPLLPGTALLLGAFERITATRGDLPIQVVAMVRAELTAAKTSHH